MEKRTTSFEDCLKIVASGHDKTAGVKKDKSLLDKLAQELGFGAEENKTSVAVPGAPVAEGEVTPAASSVAGAAPAVAGAVEAVAAGQVALAGGNAAESAAGEVAAVAKPNEGVAISAGDGAVTDANNLNKTPEAVAAAAVGGGGDEGAAAAPATDSAVASAPEKEAEKIGQLIAQSFQTYLEKAAADQEYVQALEILKEAGLLEGYNIKDPGMSKEASYTEGGLEKIANRQPLSRQEIVGAAAEFIELQKEASAAEEQGRQDARNLVEFVGNIQKEAVDGAAETTKTASDEEKVAGLLKDQEVVKAVQLLKSKNLI